MKEIILYSASWCGACKSMREWFFSIETPGVVFRYIDIEQEPAESITSLPTIVFKENGVEANRLTGVIGKHGLIKNINLTFGVE